MPSVHLHAEQKHTEEMQAIITAPPSWLLQWGITLFFGLLVLLISLSALIRYPDTIKTQLKINSYNSPKPVVTKVSGKLVRVLVREKQVVSRGQILAYLESTAEHEQVLGLQKSLKKAQNQLFANQSGTTPAFNTPTRLQLGELQSFYQSFYQAYLTYRASVTDGFYLKKKVFLQNDLFNIRNQKAQLLAQQLLQERDFNLAKQEYEVHQKLFEQKVEPLLEFRREEVKLLTKEYPIQQIKSSLLQNDGTYSAKEREIVELENQMKDEKLRFIQALNTLISEIDNWRSKYILSAHQGGTVSFSGIVQENQSLSVDQEIFYISPRNSTFFGEMNIQQYNMGKVAEGQRVIIKLKSYPYEEFGVMWGKLEYISDVPIKDSVFISKVSIEKNAFLELRRPVILKNGMLANAEIITEDASLLSRIINSIKKVMR